MSMELKDRREFLFGRSPDLDLLSRRALNKGVTFVLGRPMMGKTWVLQELARSLANDEKQWLTDRPKFLVGYHECRGEQDQLLRAVSDLYTRWLDNAKYAEQAKSLWKKRSPSGLLEGVAGAISGLFEKLDPGKIVGLELGGLVKSTFEKLISANADLKSGGLQIPQLPYEIALDLIRHLSSLSGQRVVLILDGWDKSPSILHERNLLEAYLRHLDEWPDVYFYVGLRHPEVDPSTLESPARVAAEYLIRASPVARIHELPLLSLTDSSEPESIRLLRYFRTAAPATANVADVKLLQLLNGYPGTLGRWLELKSELVAGENLVGRLTQIAADAQANLYPEFDQYLPKLTKPERLLAIRLALVFRLDAAAWATLGPILNAGIPEDTTWRDLAEKRVLDGQFFTFPNYGHDTRHQAARRWFDKNENYRPHLYAAADKLIAEFAAHIDGVEVTTRLFGEAILAVAAGLEEKNLSEDAQLTVLATRTLFREAIDSALFAEIALNSTSLAAHVPLLALALVNVAIYANDQKELARRDALLDQLRQLSRRNPDNLVARAQLAQSLCNLAIQNQNAGKFPERNGLLEELGRLHHQFSHDASIAARLAKLLFNVVGCSPAESLPLERGKLLEQLRDLHRAFPEEPEISLQFAKTLFKLTEIPVSPQARASRDTFSEELRQLHRALPTHRGVRIYFAGLLCNEAQEEHRMRNFAQRDALLDELLQLYENSPNDEALLAPMLSGLDTALHDPNSASAKKWAEVRGRLERAFTDHPQLARSHERRNSKDSTG